MMYLSRQTPCVFTVLGAVSLLHVEPIRHDSCFVSQADALLRRVAMQARISAAVTASHRRKRELALAQQALNTEVCNIT